LLDRVGRGTLAGLVDWFATAAKGTEGVLRDELRELAFEGVRADRGGVHFQGPLSEGYRACLWSRIAVRVLSPITSFACPDEAALYEGVREHDFSDVLSERHTLAVSASCRSSGLTHTQYIAQRTKDAIVDRLRERFGARPDVDKDDPDVLVFVHLVHDRATVYLDFSGDALHLRGYRRDTGLAPLKETLAAAILRLARFDGEAPLVDPMCGSGTFLVEAALIAERRAPGLLRKRFGFERWRNFGRENERAIAELRGSAQALVRARPAPIVGADVSGAALDAARANAARAGVQLELAEQPLRAAKPAFPYGVLVSNPPYGERLARPPELPRELARVIDRYYRWDCALILKSEEPMGRTRRKPRLFSLFNGDIECSLRYYEPVRSNTPEE
jgi:putative N6-adenine-specific DNA methylase